MKVKAVVGALALSAFVMSGVALAQDAAPSAPGTMAPIPNPPDAPKPAKHAKKHAKKHRAAAKKASAPAAAPAQ